MSDFRLRLLIVALFLASFAGVLTLYSNSPSDPKTTDIMTAIPLAFGHWKGEDFVVSEDIFNILQTKSILMREYRNNYGDKVTLSLVYYPDNKLGFHAPEACLGGIGYTIVEDGTKYLKFSTSSHDSLKIRWLHYNRNQTQELIYYFYETNNFITSHYLSFRWQMLINQLRYKQTNGALVRVSTTINPHASTENILNDFLFAIIPFINNYIKFKQ